MDKMLLNVIFASEKRMHVLLMLQEGPRGMETILEHLHTTRPVLIPQLKILKDHHLLYQDDEVFGLTVIGKLIADKMIPFLDIIGTLDDNNNYLASHKVDGIPGHLLSRISEVRGCSIIDPGHVNTHEMNADYLQEALISRAVYFVFTFMHPACPSILGQLVDKDIDVSIIFNMELVQKLKEECFEEFRYFLSSGKVKFYMYQKNVRISSLTVTDNGFLLRLLYRNNDFSNKQVICLDPKGRQWGMDLYHYHRMDSTPITKI